MNAVMFILAPRTIIPLYGIIILFKCIFKTQMFYNLPKHSVYSVGLFIHDSEIDPTWNATDDILYKSYNEFNEHLQQILEIAAGNVIQDLNGKIDYDNRVKLLPVLTTLGSTADKRVLFMYNPDDQYPEFYADDDFSLFAKKVYKHLTESPQKTEPFTIFSDKKALIIVGSDKVAAFFDTLIKQFTKQEDYEICTNISKMLDEWVCSTTTIKSIDNSSETESE